MVIHMSFENVIKKATVGREYSELDIKRMDYTAETPEYYDGDSITFNGVDLGNLNEQTGVGKNGKEYTRKWSKLAFFNDIDEEKVEFNLNFWKFDDTTVNVRATNPLSNLIKYLANDSKNNTFDIDYEELQKFLTKIVSIVIKIKVIEVRNGYSTYGFDVVGVKFKDEE